MAYQIFISFKNEWEGKPTRDSEIAQALYTELKKYNVEVFFSNEEIKRKGRPDYGRLIDSALDSSSVLLLIGTKAEFVNSRWVEYEWDLFNNEICSGRKDGKIITVLEGMNVGELPIGMRRWQSYDMKNSTAADAAEMAVNALKSLTATAAAEGDENSEQTIKELLMEATDCFMGICGKAPDYVRSFNLWEKAAGLGSPRAQYNLGCCYRYGWGVKTDKDAAKHWLYLAAAQGDKDAEKELASLP